jgi:DNA-binding XRE family transcriptional regulator
MTDTDTITLSRTEYDALVSRNEELEDRLLAMEAEDGSRIPHEVAILIMSGMSPLAAFRNHLGISLRGLSQKTGISRSYLSEIERGRKSGSTATISRIAEELGTNIDTLIM